MRRAIGWLVVLLILGGGGYWWFKVRAPAQNAQAVARRALANLPIPVVVAPVVRRDVPIYLEGLGTVQASATVTVHSQIDGKLIEVDFKEGQDVKAGDVLARIDPRAYQAALDQAIAKKAQDQAALTNARLDVVRYGKLAAQAYTSAQQYDTARSQVAQDEALVAADQAQIDTARVNLGYTTITAPIDGRTGIRQVDAGNIVHASDAGGLVVLTTLKPISVVFTLPQQTLRAVNDAIAAAREAGTMPVAIALPQEGTNEVLDQGTLTVLDNQVDSTTGTIKLKASFPNTNLRLWPGAFATIRLLVQTAHNVVTVPPVAVQRGPVGPYAWVMKGDSAVERRPITVGHEDLTTSIIPAGLQPGERVVIDGAARLNENSRVAVVPPAGPPTVTPPRPRPQRAPGTARPAP
jgi:multidrug efflux system membrane fusion protein